MLEKIKPRNENVDVEMGHDSPLEGLDHPNSPLQVAFSSLDRGKYDGGERIYMKLRIERK